MSRTYTDTPEPRYVERAAFADNGGGGDPGYEVTTEESTCLASVQATFESQYGMYYQANITTGVQDVFDVGDTVRFVIDGQTYEDVAREEQYGGSTVIAAGDFDPAQGIVNKAIGYDPSLLPTMILSFFSGTEPTDDVVSASKLHEVVTPTDEFKKAVVASGNGAFIVWDVDGTLDRTYEEIVDAMNAGRQVLIYEGSASGKVSDALFVDFVKSATYHNNTSTYRVSFGSNTYSTSSPDDYPNAGIL